MPDIRFDSFSDFLNMGGYAFYVWTAYLFWAVVLGGSLVMTVLDRKRVMNS